MHEAVARMLSRYECRGLNEYINALREILQDIARIVEPIAAYASVIPMVLQHHEHFNGRGYPGGVAGEELSLGARILAVADVYDALISDRPYRKGMELDKTLSIIKENSGTQFDPNAVEAFLKVVG